MGNLSVIISIMCHFHSIFTAPLLCGYYAAKRHPQTPVASEISQPTHRRSHTRRKTLESRCTCAAAAVLLPRSAHSKHLKILFLLFSSLFSVCFENFPIFKLQLPKKTFAANSLTANFQSRTTDFVL
jgi:hypothetical protein